MKFVSFILITKIRLTVWISPFYSFSWIYLFVFIVTKRENWPFPESVIDFGLISNYDADWFWPGKPISYAFTEIVIWWFILKGILHYFLPLLYIVDNFITLSSWKYNSLVHWSYGTCTFCLRTTAIGA